MRVKLGSVAFLTAAGSGYGIGLDDDGHLIEFVGDWRGLAELEPMLGGQGPVYLEVDDWAVVAVDDQVRIPLAREGMIERARFVRSALGSGESFALRRPTGLLGIRTSCGRGTAVSTDSARRGGYYAGSGNEFWLYLYQSGITPVLLAPVTDAQILD